MFDEYAHIISNGLDADSNLIEKLNNAIASSMNIRTTSYKADTYNGFKARVSGGNETTSLIRTHFAVAFTKGDGKEKDVDRKKTIRNAFNSPFRPFVLASTSIGQEGLDFHNYCRRIVHWNLPSNPIDLEQREGRINRFECLAIRQNIAKRYGDISFESNVWKEMFEIAEKEENSGKGSDLIPFWGLTKSDDMIKIERIVPMYPFSRDVLAYERLIKILSLYRLTLGQARQEELLDYILESCEDIDSVKNQFINLSPYYVMVDRVLSFAEQHGYTVKTEEYIEAEVPDVTIDKEEMREKFEKVAAYAAAHRGQLTDEIKKDIDDILYDTDELRAYRDRIREVEDSVTKRI